MINEFRNMKDHGGRTTSQQHLVPLVLNQKPPDDEEELWGCLVPYQLYTEKLPGCGRFCASFVWEEHHVTQDCRSAWCSSKAP